MMWHTCSTLKTEIERNIAKKLICEEKSGVKKMSSLYKDERKIQHRNKAEYEESIRDLADQLRNAKNLDEGCFLLKDALINKDTPHKPCHTECNYTNVSNVSGRPTEKRICRCMYYYDENAESCKKCTFKKKMELKNSSRYHIRDYEVPMEFVISNVGGIDLEILDKETGIVYAAEVKPPKSHESLVRMIAEILTYTIGKVSDIYRPAICFFDGSCQATDFKKAEIQNNDDFQYLLQMVDVFYITQEEHGNVCRYAIHNNKEEPLCKS